jgi:hypothetical protein
MRNGTGFQLHDRLAAGLLVARRDDGILGQWVRIRRRRRLFDQAADDARLDRIEDVLFGLLARRLFCLLGGPVGLAGRNV